MDKQQRGLRAHMEINRQLCNNYIVANPKSLRSYFGFATKRDEQIDRQIKVYQTYMDKCEALLDQTWQLVDYTD